MNRRSLVSLMAVLTLVGAGIHGALAAPITYVDATDGAGGNTALAAGGVWNPTTSSTDTGVDNIWRKRSGLANGGTVYEASGQGGPAGAPPSENAERLVTTISGLTSGQSYKLYAFFWSPNDINQQWLLRAGLTNSGGDLDSWTRLNNDAVNNSAGVVVASGSSFPITPDHLAPFPAMGAADFANPAALLSGTATQAGKTVIAESSRYLWQAAVGTAVADANGEAKVYIDDYVLSGGIPPTGAQTVNNRTWFDGVGYELVPEPATLVVLFLGLPVLALGRQRF
jgi:hypothetical protein